MAAFKTALANIQPTKQQEIMGLGEQWKNVLGHYRKGSLKQYFDDL